MKPDQTICLIGQVIVDVLPGNRLTPRLGGVLHAARALYALNCPYVLAYIAPSYLDKEISNFATQHGAVMAMSIGTVHGCPNVLFVGEAQETGDQRYEMILDGHFHSSTQIDHLKELLSSYNITDVLIFPGGFNLKNVSKFLRTHKVKVHIDINFEPADPKRLGNLGRNFETIIISTSSSLFRTKSKDASEPICNLFSSYTNGFLLKENRGGSRFFPTCSSKRVIRTPSHPRKIVHSVGVGDCFNAVFVALRHKYTDKTALSYASMIAADYACELNTERFKEKVIATLKIQAREMVAMRGVLLDWETRLKTNIYVAAPDFRSLDLTHINAIIEALKYHNFSPRCPVRENGEVPEDATVHLKTQTAKADIHLLRQCSILVAVLTFDDPGTLIEIGVALAWNIPVIVYDPRCRASNLILTQLPRLVSSNLDEVVTEIFKAAAEIHQNEKTIKHTTRIRRS